MLPHARCYDDFAIVVSYNPVRPIFETRERPYRMIVPKPYDSPTDSISIHGLRALVVVACDEEVLSGYPFVTRDGRRATVYARNVVDAKLWLAVWCELEGVRRDHDRLRRLAMKADAFALAAERRLRASTHPVLAFGDPNDVDLA